MFTKPRLTVFGVAIACATLASAQTGVPSQDAAGWTAMTATADGGVITPAQRARLDQKLALISRIALANDLSAAGVPASADQKRWLMESLYSMPLEQLRAMGIPGSYSATAAAISSTKPSTKALGDAQSDLVYRPITPCRYIDTRNVGGPLSGTRDFDLHNNGLTYGGSASCDPKSAVSGSDPANIGAIAFNLGIVNPINAPGHIGARPFGSADNTSMVNWYQAGATASNAGQVSIDQASGQIEFFGTPGTDIVVDMMGVFTAPAPTALDCVTVTLVSPSIANGGRTFAQPTCAPGYSVTGGGVVAATNDNQVVEASEPTGSNGWFTAVLNNSGASRIFTFSANCCRVPGR